MSSTIGESSDPVAQVRPYYQNIETYNPEPRNTVGSVFGSLLGVAKSALGGAVPTSVGIEPEYASLLSEQLHQQEQMQLVSLYSNIEKSKHETQMAAIRNVRAG